MTKFKGLSLALLAALAVSGIAVMNASAESQSTGHFTSEVAHTTLDVFETEADQLELGIEGFEEITCDSESYTGTIKGETVTEITVNNIVYAECYTTGGSPGEVHVEMNSCDYLFTQPNKVAENTEHTVSLDCEGDDRVEITHTNAFGTCHIEIPPAEHLKGVGYHTITLEEKHAITVSSDVSGIPVKLVAGFCTILGQNQNGVLTGSAIVQGTDDEENVVDITATGSED